MSSDDVPAPVKQYVDTAANVGTLGLAGPKGATEELLNDANDPGGIKRAKASRDKEQEHQDALIGAQNAADARTQADAVAKTNAARLELLGRQGYSSTILSGPGLLGRQASLGA